MQDSVSKLDIRIRIAAYYEDRQEPHVHDISAASPREATREALKYIGEVFAFPADKPVPEEALKELIDNLIHAEYKGALVSLLEGGSVVRVSDKGPGIEDKERAFEFGYSGARLEVLQQIRGVGAGLGIARAAAEKAGGMVFLDENIGGGTVAMISMVKPAREPVGTYSYESGDVPEEDRLSARQRNVLLAVVESGIVGPSAVAERLWTSVTTAYRDLNRLAEYGLVARDAELHPGKAVITSKGHEVAERITGVRRGPAFYDEVSEFLDKFVDEQLKEMLSPGDTKNKDAEES